MCRTRSLKMEIFSSAILVLCRPLSWAALVVGEKENPHQEGTGDIHTNQPTHSLTSSRSNAAGD